MILTRTESRRAAKLPSATGPRLQLARPQTTPLMQTSVFDQSTDVVEHGIGNLDAAAVIALNNALHRRVVTGLGAVDLAVLIRRQELQVHRIERDETEIARLIQAGRAFWREVELDQALAARDGD